MYNIKYLALIALFFTLNMHAMHSEFWNEPKVDLNEIHRVTKSVGTNLITLRTKLPNKDIIECIKHSSGQSICTLSRGVWKTNISNTFYEELEKAYE